MRARSARADEGGALALRGVGCRLHQGRLGAPRGRGLAARRALDGEQIKIQDLQLHAPTLDDVFLAKTGRSLEGAAEEAEQEEAKEAVAA
jgi:hypothetical protein